MVNTPVFTGFFTSQVVVWDFWSITSTWTSCFKFPRNTKDPKSAWGTSPGKPFKTLRSRHYAKLQCYLKDCSKKNKSSRHKKSPLGCLRPLSSRKTTAWNGTSVNNSKNNLTCHSLSSYSVYSILILSVFFVLQNFDSLHLLKWPLTITLKIKMGKISLFNDCASNLVAIASNLVAIVLFFPRASWEYNVNKSSKQMEYKNRAPGYVGYNL